VSLLLEEGADIHAKNQIGMTCLHLAAKSNCGSFPIAKLCVQHGAVVDATTKRGTTPLMMQVSFERCLEDPEQVSQMRVIELPL